MHQDVEAGEVLEHFRADGLTTLAQKSGFAGEPQKLLVLLGYRVLSQGVSDLLNSIEKSLTLNETFIYHLKV